jgi:hydrogenase maturation protein HypF
VEVIKRQLERRINSPLTSSMGRLFDAISALLGIRGEIAYEGQAAVELEMAAHAYCGDESSSSIAGPIASGASELDDTISGDEERYPYHIMEDKGIRIVQLKGLLAALIEDFRNGIAGGRISVKFHNTIALMINEMCNRVAGDTPTLSEVALSGGVFQNRLLLRKTVSLLEGSGFHVFTHRQVPCNDGGISLGQAVIAHFAAITARS